MAVTTTRFSITIPELPPSPNRTRRSTHWTARMALDRYWKEQAWWAAKEEAMTPPRWTRVRLSMHFTLPDKRRRDPGNLLGSEGIKALIDGLVAAEVMTDDSVDVIAEYGPFTFEYMRGKPSVTVTVEPI